MLPVGRMFNAITFMTCSSQQANVAQCRCVIDVFRVVVPQHGMNYAVLSFFSQDPDVPPVIINTSAVPVPQSDWSRDKKLAFTRIPFGSDGSFGLGTDTNQFLTYGPDGWGLAARPSRFKIQNRQLRIKKQAWKTIHVTPGGEWALDVSASPPCIWCFTIPQSALFTKLGWCVAWEGDAQGPYCAVLKFVHEPVRFRIITTAKPDIFTITNEDPVPYKLMASPKGLEWVNIVDVSKHVPPLVSDWRIYCGGASFSILDTFMNVVPRGSIQKNCLSLDQEHYNKFKITDDYGIVVLNAQGGVYFCLYSRWFPRSCSFSKRFKRAKTPWVSAL